MKLLIGALLILVIGGAATPAHAQAIAVIADKDRLAAGGRAVQIGMQQRNIETTVDIGRVANASFGGGLIGALIIEASDDRAERMRATQRARAEAVVAPLRELLSDFDVAGLARAATSPALAKLDWLQARAITETRGGAAGRAAALAAAPGASQLATIDYRYELSPDFSQIRVIATVTIERLPAAKAPSRILYRQRIQSVVQLRTRSYEQGENVALWSADDARLARRALTAAFAQFEQLIPQALDLDAKGLAALTAKSREKAFAAGFYGPLIARGPRNPEDLLIWSDGLVHVQTVP